MHRGRLAKAAVTIGLLVAAGHVSVKVHAEQAAIVPQPVSVAQLTEILQKAKRKRDGELAKELENLQLNERLSSARLAALSAELPGAKSKNALMAVGDASVFLEPPGREIPGIATPDIAEQRRIMALALEYLEKTLPKLPNFFANRNTVSFEAIRMENDRAQSGAPVSLPLHWKGEAKASVLYRDQKEVVRPVSGSASREVTGLSTWGTFGPILSTVILDAAHGKTTWSHWEQAGVTPLAVFRYEVPQAESHYKVSTGVFQAQDEDNLFSDRTAYHGEIGIDASTGTILRLTLEAEPHLDATIERADIMVEYGLVDIGGKKYTCPVRSVSVSAGHALEFAALAGVGATHKVMRLNDVTFNGYHMFRSEIRILP